MKLEHKLIRTGCYEVTSPNNPGIKFWTSSTKSSQHLLQAVLSHTNNKLSPKQLASLDKRLTELEAIYQEKYGDLDDEDEEDMELGHREASRNSGGLEYVFGITRGKPGDKFLTKLGSHEDEPRYKEATRDDYSVLEYTLGINSGKIGDDLLNELGGRD